MNRNDFVTLSKPIQWHETKILKERGGFFFLKRYIENSYEIRNELNWLTSTSIRSCQTFTVPEVVSANINEGYIKMRYIPHNEFAPDFDLIEKLILVAAELHAVMKSTKPFMRKKDVSVETYPHYVKKFAETRIRQISDSNACIIPQEIKGAIRRRSLELHPGVFTIVHRDLRCRHLLNQEGNRPVLIDWEFSNVSDPSQDLAKLIYDGVVNHNMKFDRLYKTVVDEYSKLTGIAKKELQERVMTFMMIIPLEHIASFVIRKPLGYEQCVDDDLAFIKKVYETQN